MPIFKYSALDQKGNSVQGLQEAESQKHAEQILASQALIPTALKPVKQTTKHTWLTQSISLKHLTFYLQQLAMMLKTGLPIETAIEALVKQTRHVKHQTILMAIKANINEGMSLSKAMAEFPKSFPNFITANVASGEQSGQLGLVLEKTTNTLVKRQRFSTQIQQALAYPLIVTFIAVLVIAALLAFVVPQIVDVFSQLDKALPPLTVGLISVSEFVQNYINHFFVGMLLLFIVVRWIKRNDSRKYYWDKFWISTPLSSLIKQIEMIQFTRTITTLLSSGVVMVEAMNHALASINNLTVMRKIKVASQKIKEGGNVFDIFEQTKLFDPTSLQLIYFGQTTGNLEQVFEQISDILEDNLDQKTKTLLSLFEPLLILTMGGIVLLIVLAIMLPILNLNQIL